MKIRMKLRSVRRKLFAIMLISICFALTISSVVLVKYDQYRYRSKLLEDLVAEAQILGSAIAPALEFDDRETAQDKLSILRARPNFLAAHVYTTEGNEFATYRRNAEDSIDISVSASSPGVRFQGNQVIVYQPITRGKEKVGGIFIRALCEDNAQLWQFAGMVLASASLALIISTLLSICLQFSVTRPILSAAALARRVTEERNYNLRAEKTTDDELGDLVDAINGLLEEVGQQRCALESANERLSAEVSERRKAQEELRETNHNLEHLVENRTRDLKRSNADLEQFAYVASHDLQEPLRAVISYLQLIERRSQDKLDKEGLEFINFAVEGAMRMQALIKALLEYSRVGSKGNAIDVVECEDVLARARKNIDLAIEESATTILHDPLPQVVGDKQQLIRLFQNLLSNAIRYRGDKPAKILVSAELQGREWVFSVRDQGIGFDGKFAERIFVIFQRLHGREDYGGTGMGLAICKKIIERHAGKIWAKSKPSEGAAFYFTLPAIVEVNHAGTESSSIDRNIAC